MKVRKKVTKADPKTIFRRSKVWKTFREKLRKMQKKDPVTGSPLMKNCNCHHLCEDPTKYTDISDDSKFICLNSMTHTCVHFLWGDAQKQNDWKTRLQRLKEICELMDEINNDFSKITK